MQFCHAASYLITSLDCGICAQNYNTEELTAYFDKYPPSNRLGVVIGGEQGNSFCASIELKTVGSQEAGTLKANCLENITGTSRDDNFCSDMEVIGDETILPCHQTELDASVIRFSDHSIITVELRPSL